MLVTFSLSALHEDQEDEIHVDCVFTLDVFLSMLHEDQEDEVHVHCVFTLHVA